MPASLRVRGRLERLVGSFRQNYSFLIKQFPRASDGESGNSPFLAWLGASSQWRGRIGSWRLCVLAPLRDDGAGFAPCGGSLVIFYCSCPRAYARGYSCFAPCGGFARLEFRVLNLFRVSGIRISNLIFYMPYMSTC